MTAINDLSQIDRAVKAEIQKAIIRVSESGWYVLGKEVVTFEQAFAHYIGVVHCITVANGTDALNLALKAMDIEEGNEVINTANAGFYSTSAILNSGATAVFCDVHAETGLMDEGSLKSLITPMTKAVIVTHLYGQLANIEAISEICRAARVALIEDCAQAHGAIRGGKKAGAWGDISCFSFYPTKNLGAFGDGGALATSSNALAEKVRKLRQYGWSKKYVVDIPKGQNSRLDEIQAAVLNVKLKFLDADNDRRRKIASEYSSKISHPGILGKPSDFTDSYVAHLYVLQATDRESLRNHLNASGIPCDVHYPVPDHMQKIMPKSHARLPVTEKLANSILTLPCYPEMSSEDVGRVIRAIDGWRL